MAYSAPGAPFIVHLEIEPIADNLFVIRADRREVYRGRDTTVADRWKEYWSERVPWSVIFQEESAHG